MYYYNVAPLKIIRLTEPYFTYCNNTELPIGKIVQVPVGKSMVLGVVISKSKKPVFKTKIITDIIDIPALPKQLIETSLWISEYYSTHLSSVLQMIIPSGVTKKRRANNVCKLEISRKRTNFVLNKYQLFALDTLVHESTGTLIMHGVTGSGKTAVYIEYAKKIIASGKSVLVLVPEISLTAQLVAEFKDHFSKLILTHSKLTESERHIRWLDALNASTPNVIIGPRSALFLPIKNIGAIIIDESHEPSYKQDQSPKYSSLRVASILAKNHGALVIQGSATPLVGEYYLAKKMNHPILELPKPASDDFIKPKIITVDSTKKLLFSEHRLLSDKALLTIRESLTKNNQVLIFHNRRGSANITLCQSCGWCAMCDRCLIPLTLHADKHDMRCHTCNMVKPVPTSCPTCHSTDIIHKGVGTKLIESEIKKLFPTKIVARFDNDTSASDTLDKRYQELYDGNINIIIGTQVIAKGLDLPKLDSVIIVQADTGLSLPDFSSSERTFQLLAQVVGRVGRSQNTSTVVVQSYQLNQPAIQYGISQNYEMFYNETLAVRNKSKFPPFTYLLKLSCVYKSEDLAIKNSKAFAEDIKNNFRNITILGPTPAFYERPDGKYKWQIVIKSPTRNILLQILNRTPSKYWQYDIDPYSLL